MGCQCLQPKKKLESEQMKNNQDNREVKIKKPPVKLEYNSDEEREKRKERNKENKNARNMKGKQQQQAKKASSSISSVESSLEDEDSDREVWEKPKKKIQNKVEEAKKGQEKVRNKKQNEVKQERIIVDKKNQEPIQLEEVKIIENSSEAEELNESNDSEQEKFQQAKQNIAQKKENKQEVKVQKEIKKQELKPIEEHHEEDEIQDDPQTQNQNAKKARSNIFNKRRPENPPQEKLQAQFNPIEEASRQPDKDGQIQLIRQKPQLLQFQSSVVQQIKELNEENLQKLKEEYKVSEEQFLPALEQIKIMKEGYQLNIVHLAIQNKDLNLVKYLLEDLKLKISLAIPKFQGDNFINFLIQNQMGVTENSDQQQNAQHVMIQLLEHIDIDILRYLLDMFSPVFEWDVVTYFMSLAVNLQDPDRKKILFKCFLECDFVKSLLLSISLNDRFIWFRNIHGLTGIKDENITYDHQKLMYELSGVTDEIILQVIESINKVFQTIQKIEDLAIHKKQDFLKLILEQDLQQLKDPKYLDIVKYFLANYSFEDDQLFPNSNRNYFTPILLCIMLKNKEILNFFFQNTRCNFFSLLTIPENTKLQMPLYTLFDFLISTNDQDFFKFFYESPLTSYYILNQEMVQNLIYLIVQRNFTDQSEVFQDIVLKSPLTHYLFNSLSIMEKIQFVESILQARGTALTQLLEYMEYNIQEDQRQSFYNDKNQKLGEIFQLIYANLSLQPYALYFFKIFPEAIVQLKLEQDEEILQILYNSRENIQESDYKQFLWHQPEFSIKVIKNYSTDKETETTPLGQIIAQFIQNLIKFSDPVLLKRQVPDIAHISAERRDGVDSKSQVQRQSSARLED